MKKFIFLTALVLMVLVINNQKAQAQEKRLNFSPQIFRLFFAKFKSAVEKNDKLAVAAMTLFPFKYGFDAGDEGTMSKAQFIKNFSRIFGKSPKQFFSEKNPLFSIGDNGSYFITTENAEHLMFVKNGNSFKFKSYVVEP